ncbi:MAG: hypothetical protein LC667_17860, partial [Thioalkalivibrio sp.]|nr:hypothetical protein [Thioalkalivibrio sp.]
MSQRWESARQTAVHFARKATLPPPEMTAPDDPLSLPRGDRRRPVILMEPWLRQPFRRVDGPFRMVSHVGWDDLH